MSCIMEENTNLLAQMPYEEELLKKLREQYYLGIPLSIFLLSDSLCLHQCHYLSIQITRGMEEFLIVRGNVNTMDKEPLGNHSWVEKDG